VASAAAAETAKSTPDALRRAAMNSGGNPGRGKALFGSQAAKCASCHKVHGQGGDVGPDLSQVGGKFDRTHLIESILDPSAQIPEGFYASTIVTKSGRFITGIVKSENSQEVVLLDVENNRLKVPIRDIDSRSVSRVSLMPA